MSVSSLSPAPGVPAPPRRDGPILFALWLLVFASASQTIIVTPILPLIGEALAVPVASLAWLVSGYSVMLAAAALVMGPVSDRVGRRRVLLWGAGVMAVTLTLHGLVRSYEGLLLARTLAGVAGGMLSGAAVSFVGDYFPYERRGWATGWVMSGVPFGLVLGIPLGRVLAVGYGFRAPFLLFAGVAAAAFALILAVVPQPNVRREAAPLALGRALRGYARLLSVRGGRTGSATAAAAAVFFLMYASLGVFTVFLPQWITAHFALGVEVFGRPLRLGRLDVDFIATLFLVGGVASVLASPRAGAFSDRVGRRPLILASCLGLAALTAAFTYVVEARWAAYAAYVAMMVLFAMRMTPLQALLTALVPATQRGTFLSLTIAVGQVGMALGAALGGVLYGGFGYRANTFASAAGVLAMALLVWQALPEPARDAPEAVPAAPEPRPAPAPAS